MRTFFTPGVRARDLRGCATFGALRRDPARFFTAHGVRRFSVALPERDLSTHTIQRVIGNLVELAEDGAQQHRREALVALLQGAPGARLGALPHVVGDESEGLDKFSSKVVVR